MPAVRSLLRDPYRCLTHPNNRTASPVRPFDLARTARVPTRSCHEVDGRKSREIRTRPQFTISLSGTGRGARIVRCLGVQQFAAQESRTTTGCPTPLPSSWRNRQPT